VIYIDPTTGALRYRGKWGYDVFGSENEAVDYITNGSRWMCKSTTFAKAILGYTALGSFGLLLVATRLTASIPNLPGGGTVCTVTESQWIKIPLQNPQPQGKGEVKNVQELPDLDIDGKHYFCETRNITRPFPSIDVMSSDYKYVTKMRCRIHLKRKDKKKRNEKRCLEVIAKLDTLPLISDSDEQCP